MASVAHTVPCSTPPTAPLPASPPTLYADLPLLRTHDIAVPGGHRLHVREWGCAHGLPALLLHGGPGSGCSPLLWRTFDPARYRVIAPDQRGAGASTPGGGVVHNTTTDLLADLRLLRRQLGITQWLVVGGSWGATLALLHALDEPQAVTGLLLRAPFLARAQDIAGFFEQAPKGLEGAWQQMANAAAPAPGQSLLEALHTGLHSPPTDCPQTGPHPSPQPNPRASAMAQAWWSWEQALAGAGPKLAPLPADPISHQVQRLRIQSHYLLHGCWLGLPTLPERCAALSALPALLVQGSADRICPPAGAALLHAHWPGSRLQTVAGAGHDPSHPAMVAAVVRALDAWAQRQAWDQDRDGGTA